MTFQPIGLPAARVVERIAAEIKTKFSGSAEIRLFKRDVRNTIRLGAGHPLNMARYGKRLALMRARLDQWQRANAFAAQVFDFTAQTSPDVALTIAIAVTEGWYRDERKTFAVAAALGYGNRLPLMVLRELRLILRLLRRSEYRGHFSGLVAFAVGSALEAAE